MNLFWFYRHKRAIRIRDLYRGLGCCSYLSDIIILEDCKNFIL